MEKTVIPACF